MKRHIDELGRIVIPKEIRKELDLKRYDELKITTKGNTIILSKEFNTDEEIKKEIKRLQSLLKDKKDK